jgi:hypothetical protein
MDNEGTYSVNRGLNGTRGGEIEFGNKKTVASQNLIKILDTNKHYFGNKKTVISLNQ